MLFSDNLIDKIEPIIKQAGKILLSYYKNSFTLTIKENQYVTTADIKSEEFLKKELNKILPNASILAEESGKSGYNEYCWVIDPLDGTTNFAQSISYFCISLGLTHFDKPIAGFIYDPIQDELFYAQEGKGAFLNGKSIKISSKSNFSNCIIATRFPSSNPKDWDKIIAIKSKCFAIRSMGASAFDLANLAAGKFDGAFFEGLKWWDMCAAIIIIKEAGGFVSQFDGTNLTSDSRTIVAGSKYIQNELLMLLKA